MGKWQVVRQLNQVSKDISTALQAGFDHHAYQSKQWKQFKIQSSYLTLKMSFEQDLMIIKVAV